MQVAQFVPGCVCVCVRERLCVSVGMVLEYGLAVLPALNALWVL